MEGNRLPVVALYGQLEGTRSRGRQPKKWIDNVKEDLMAQGMNMREALDNSRNRRFWRSLVEAARPHRRRTPDGGEIHDSPREVQKLVVTRGRVALLRRVLKYDIHKGEFPDA